MNNSWMWGREDNWTTNEIFDKFFEKEPKIDIEYLFNQSSKDEFSTFLEQDTQGNILKIVDNIEIIKTCKNIENRIGYILVSSKYRDELFKNKNFRNLFLSTDLSSYKSAIDYCNFTTIQTLLQDCLERNNLSTAAQLFSYLNEDKQKKLINLFKGKEQVYGKLLTTSSNDVVNIILNEFSIDLSNEDINLKYLFERCRQSSLKRFEMSVKYGKKISQIEMNSNLLTKEVFERLYKNYDIFELRNILNNAVYGTNISFLENMLEKQEDKLIKNAKEDTLLPQFSIIESMLFENERIDNQKNISNIEHKTYYSNKKNLNKILRQLKINLKEELEKLNQPWTIENIRKILKKYNTAMISNYIIDYHFKENYYNIMLDLKELLNMYYSGNLPLDEEKINLYQDVYNVDNMTIEEQQELHSKLKNINIQEIFYDDMSFARKTVAEEIKNASLTKEELVKYEDKKLTEKYGVPVYNLSGKEFFGIVKSGRHTADELPTGHSYSLVGDAGLVVYGNDKNTYLYDSSTFNSEQIVHVYPYDSYTLYRPYESVNEPTSRVNILASPDELVKIQPLYNELLILENGKRNIEESSKIKNLEIIAKYCVDEIREDDVQKATANGIGIMFVDSSKCPPTEDYSQSSYRHKELSTNQNYDYVINGIIPPQYKEERMKRI